MKKGFGITFYVKDGNKIVFFINEVTSSRGTRKQLRESGIPDQSEKWHFWLNSNQRRLDGVLICFFYRFAFSIL